MDECVFTPCSNGGTCQNTLGSYLCNCPAGWIGKHCDVGKDRNFIKNLCIQMHVHLICLIYYIITFEHFYQNTGFFSQMSTNVSIFRVSEAVFASTLTGPTCVNVPMAGRDRTVNSVSASSYKKKKNKTHAWFLCYKMTNILTCIFTSWIKKIQVYIWFWFFIL